MALGWASAKIMVTLDFGHRHIMMYIEMKMYIESTTCSRNAVYLYLIGDITCWIV